MRRKVTASSRRQYGQVLPLFALTVVAMFAIGALVVDLGFLFGQRRFDQNGADAAALAAGRFLASNVSPRDTSGNVFFSVADADVYEIVRQYAGLDPDDYASNVPTGTNQNAGLFGRNLLEVTLEYSTQPGVWCYSPTSGVVPPRSPAVPPCNLPTATVAGQPVAFPPYPIAPNPYRVRVTVSSTTGHFLAQVMEMITGSVPTTVPPPPTSESVAACVAIPGAAGSSESTTCAHAVVAIKGKAEMDDTGPLLPVTTGDCAIGSNSVGQLFQLWGSNPEGCGYNINPWKNMLDYTEAESWCDDLSGGSTPNPDYKYEKLLPNTLEPTTDFARTSCTRGPDDWDRDGYDPGPYQTQLTGQTDHDIPFLIAKGFGGWIRADYADGNKIPTYVDANPAQGANLGQNIAVGFYCGSSATPEECPANPANWYFFAQNQPGFMPVCDDWYGSEFNLGCRDAVIPTWGDDNDPTNLNPDGIDWAFQLNTGGSAWVHSGGGGPDRVRIVRLLNMRLYCAYKSPGLCTEPPNAVVGSSANSDVWGRFVSPFEGDPCTTCIGAPTIYGNVAVLER